MSDSLFSTVLEQDPYERIAEPEISKSMASFFVMSLIYNSSLSQSATPFVLVEKVTPTAVIGKLRRRKLAA